MSFVERLAHAWNVFKGEPYGPLGPPTSDYALGGYNPGHYRVLTSDRTILASIMTRISIDVAMIRFVHAKVDGNERYIEPSKSGLNECLTFSANIDQAAMAFKEDLVMTILREGVAAIVPVETDLDPNDTGGYDIRSLRVGTITQWYPQHVRVELYNEKRGIREEVLVEKAICAIVENPLYHIMNEPNSTLQRLIRKLSLMDQMDERIGSDKLDVIIQLPYQIKSEARRVQADKRLEDIRMQLKSSEYGIAYTDSTEKITQLNRPVENNILPTVDRLMKQLYSYLGITEAVLEGTASEPEMLNYYNRTVGPIATAIAQAMTRTFLTKTARTQGQRIVYYRKPFDLVPMSDLAEVADKLSRNEILTSNEVRSIIGFAPMDDPRADELRNSNMPVKDTERSVLEDPPSTRQNEKEERYET